MTREQGDKEQHRRRLAEAVFCLFLPSLVAVNAHADAPNIVLILAGE